ncbi:hypothetical protein ACFX5D_12535 [Flavobacterium sp. LB3P45]|uniref:Uncharacterized protein n=1 Tax=Flavobacterium fructosi TaxID=3230416 RepID=A0ABW6HP07_9FLAO
MPTKNIMIFIVILFVISFLVIFFITSSNYYKECDNVVNKELDKNGIEAAKKEHGCNEKYSF